MTSRSGIRSENRRVGNGRGSSKQAGSVLRRLGATTAFRPSLSFVLLTVFLGVLWIAGGASRGDVPGQIVVRGAAWAVLIVAALFAPKPMLKRERPVLVFLLLALALPILQLVPLPPAIWQALPGRALFTEAATALGETQPWRPIAIVPSATFNAAASLIVPLTILVLIGGLRESERSLLPTVLLGLVATSTLLALLQFSGSRFNNPLINDTVGQISASFANRNHLALFLAYGCLLAPTWAFLKSTQSLYTDDPRNGITRRISTRGDRARCRTADGTTRHRQGHAALSSVGLAGGGRRQRSHLGGCSPYCDQQQPCRIDQSYVCSQRR
jgi:hypothetical protein